MHLWPELRSGGLYFIEDLQVSRPWAKDNGVVVADVIFGWVDQLLGGTFNGNTHSQLLPKGLKFVACGNEACVFGKKAASDAKVDAVSCSADTVGVRTAVAHGLQGYDLLFGILLLPAYDAAIAGGVGGQFSVCNAQEFRGHPALMTGLEGMLPEANVGKCQRLLRWYGYDAVIVEDTEENAADTQKHFEQWWPQVKPGGALFISMQEYSGDDKHRPIARVLKNWVDQLVGKHQQPYRQTTWDYVHVEDEASVLSHHPIELPLEAKLIFCGPRSCAIVKCASNDPTHQCRPMTTPWSALRVALQELQGTRPK